MKRTLCSALIAGLFAGSPGRRSRHPAIRTRRPPRAQRPPHCPFRRRRRALDAAVRPQDDFFRYSQGKWLKDVDIPNDRSSWGAFNIAQDNVEGQIRTLIEQAAQDKNAKAGSDTPEDGRLLRQLRRRGAPQPARPGAAEGRNWRASRLKDKKALGKLAAHFERIGAGAPVDMVVHQDNKDSTRYIVDISQSGLGMPNRDFYLQDEARLADTRAKYQAHVEKMLALAGHKDAAAEAKAIVALETEIARRSGAPSRTAIRSRATTS
jgi:putative endopeptidase